MNPAAVSARLGISDMQSPADFYSSLDKKAMAAGAIIFDARGRLLIVDPVYAEGWIVPGGMVEADESPAEACKREIKEELGISVHLTRLLCIDYKINHDTYEVLQFMFEAAPVTDAVAEGIILQAEELKNFGFFEPEEALKLLAPRLSKRVKKCLEARRAGTCAYLEQGEDPLGVK